MEEPVSSTLFRNKPPHTERRVETPIRGPTASEEHRTEPPPIDHCFRPSHQAWPSAGSRVCHSPGKLVTSHADRSLPFMGHTNPRNDTSSQYHHQPYHPSHNFHHHRDVSNGFVTLPPIQPPPGLPHPPQHLPPPPPPHFAPYPVCGQPPPSLVSPQPDPYWRGYQSDNVNPFPNTNALPPTPTHIPGQHNGPRNMKNNRRGFQNHRSMTSYEAPPQPTYLEFLEQPESETKNQASRRSSAHPKSTAARSRQPCSNSGAYDAPYVSCACNACVTRNHSVHVKTMGYLASNTMDLRAFLKRGLGDLFGHVEEVYATPSNRPDPSKFLVR